MGQTPDETPRAGFLSNGSLMEFQSTPIDPEFKVLGQLDGQSGQGGNELPADCGIAEPSYDFPYVSSYYGPAVGTVDTSIRRWTFPLDTEITRVRFRMCWTLNGPVDTDLEVRPIIFNKSTGTILHEGPPLAQIGGPTPPVSTIYYSEKSARLVELNWTLPTPISSRQLSLQNLEMGLLVTDVNSPWGQCSSYPCCRDFPCVHSVNTSAVLIHALILRATFITTPSPNPASVGSHTMSVSGGQLRVRTAMPSPSTATGIRWNVICPNSSIQEIGRRLYYSNDGTGFASMNVSASGLNQACQVTTYKSGSTVQVEAFLINGMGSTFGFPRTASGTLP
jgi:hypothetical protein